MHSSHGTPEYRRFYNAIDYRDSSTSSVDYGSDLTAVEWIMPKLSAGRGIVSFSVIPPGQLIVDFCDLRQDICAMPSRKYFPFQKALNCFVVVGFDDENKNGLNSI